MISIIIPCLGHRKELEDCLDALVAQEGNLEHEILVVDSGHDPEVVELGREYSTVRVLRGEPGLDPGQARDLGTANAAGEILVFTDADCVPEPDFLSAASSAIDSGISAATGPVLDALRGWIPACDNLLQFVAFAPHRPEGPAHHAPGCNFVVLRKDYLELGGFGAGGGEDVRLSGRVAETVPGGIVFRPDLRVRHRGRESWREYLQHHEAFGYIRGSYRLLLTERQHRLGSYTAMILPIAMRRYLYVLGRTVAWNRSRIPFVLMMTPVLLVGLIRWAVGFRRGVRDE